MKHLFKSKVWFAFLHSAIIISWQPNTDSDLKGYKVYYGTRSRMYDQVESVGIDTTCSIDNLKGGKSYYIAVTAFDINGNESSYSEELVVNLEEELNSEENSHLQNSYNYPNPFNPLNEATTIRFFLQSPQYVTIHIYNEQGDIVSELLKSQFRNSGEHVEDKWNGYDTAGNIVQNGVYYCQIQTELEIRSFPIVVIK